MEMQIPATLPDKWDLYLAAHRLPPLCIADGGARRGCTHYCVKHTTRGAVEVMQTSKRNTSAPVKRVSTLLLSGHLETKAAPASTSLLVIHRRPGQLSASQKKSWSLTHIFITWRLCAAAESCLRFGGLLLCYSSHLPLNIWRQISQCHSPGPPESSTCRHLHFLRHI